MTKTYAEEIAARLIEVHPIGTEITVDDFKRAITDGAGLDGGRKEIFEKYLDFFQYNELIEISGYGRMFVSDGCELFLEAYERRTRKAEPTITLEAFDTQYLEVLR